MKLENPKNWEVYKNASFSEYNKIQDRHSVRGLLYPNGDMIIFDVDIMHKDMINNFINNWKDDKWKEYDLDNVWGVIVENGIIIIPDVPEPRAKEKEAIEKAYKVNPFLKVLKRFESTFKPYSRLIKIGI